MILGNSGIVMVVAIFVVFLRANDFFRPSLTMLVVAASLFVLYRIAMHREFTRKLGDKIRELIKKTLHFE